LRRGFRDRDFIQTVEDFLFCVIGSVHPTDRIISYVKYIPAEGGVWRRGEKGFKRIMRYYTMLDLIGTLNFLEKYPEYLYDSDVMGIRISAVPLNRVLMHFKPEDKMRELANANRLDYLQSKALNLALIISDESGVPLEFFGVTGSILLDIHQSFSDIDLTVYGVESNMRVKEALKRIYLLNKFGVRRFNSEEAREWCLNKSEMYPLTYEEAKILLDRRWNRGVFQGTMFSIHPVKLEDEVNEKYGDKIFRFEGMITIEATVLDDSEIDFMPSVYAVGDVKVIEGPPVKDIRELVSYEGLYSGLASKGERVRAYGKLERVIDIKRNEEYYRVLVGSQEAHGRDYIKPLL
jgi:predicted nucleotidyltransferase